MSFGTLPATLILLPSLPVEEDTVDEEDVEEDEVVFLPPSREEENVLSAKEPPDQESTFKDVVSFVREHYGLGPLKEVPPKVLKSHWSKSLRKGPAPGRPLHP